MTAEITVIIPVYNAQKTIERCIQSVMKQTYKKWISYIIDDGSSDQSAEICNDIARQDNRIRVFHKENGGVSSARNFAISRIETPYFVCIDSDDFVEPEYLELLIDTKKKYPEFGGIWTGFQTVDDAKMTRTEIHIASKNEKYSFFKRNEIMILHQKWLSQMPFSKLYDTKVVRDNHIMMDDAMTVGEDLVFNIDYLDALVNADIVVINAAPYNYVRWNGDSLDHKYQKNALMDSKKIIRRMQSAIKSWDVGVDGIQDFYNIQFYMYERVLRNTFHPDNMQQKKEKLRYNNALLRSEEFKAALKKRTCKINKFILFAYKLKKYEINLWIEDIARKRKICKKRQKK